MANKNLYRVAEISAFEHTPTIVEEICCNGNTQQWNKKLTNPQCS